MVLDAAYLELKNQVIKAERRVLKELGFCVHVKHPHKVSNNFIFIYFKKLGTVLSALCTAPHTHLSLYSVVC